MGNQEQQFYTPENQSPERYSPTPSNQYHQTPNSVNVDLREQQQQEMYGGPEYYTGRGEKLQPSPPRRKRFRAFWIVPLILLFLIGGMSYGLFGSHERYDKRFGSSKNEQTFKNVANPKLIINDTSGTIHIHSNEDSSNAHTVTVRIDKSGGSQPDPTVKFDNANGIITIVANSQGFGDNNVNVDITTPNTSNVQLTDGNGDINIEGVTGTIDAQTTKGRINADHVSGKVTLSSTDGDVSLENGSLSGQSSLHTENGDIRYNGSIAAQGSYKFDTVNGSVEVRLPSDTAFHLDAKHPNGRYENEFGSSDVGSGTRPSLTVSSENGSIQVSKNG